MGPHGALSLFLNSTKRTASTGTKRMALMSNVTCTSTDQFTYIFCPEIDACASSSLLGPPPLTDGQSIRGLIIHICFFTLWSEIKQSVISGTGGGMSTKGGGRIFWSSTHHFCPFPLQLQCLGWSLCSQSQGLKICLSVADGNWCRERVLRQKETPVLWICLAELYTSGDDRQAGNNPQNKMVEVKSNQRIRIAGLLNMGFIFFNIPRGFLIVDAQ